MGYDLRNEWIKERTASASSGTYAQYAGTMDIRAKYFRRIKVREVLVAQGNNVRLIEDIYAAFAKGDLQSILNRITDDVDWINEGPESIPYAGIFKGRQEVERFFQGLGSTLDSGRVTATEWIAEGDNVVSLGRFSATVKKTAKRIDVPVAHVFTIRDDKIARWVGFSDTARVAEAYAEAAMGAA